ncbi:Uncharacterized protein Rs2_13821 [Raphanus sativus]|nr:Uncharacterized protein Rs2_13821 [Raphanus sativus]
MLPGAGEAIFRRRWTLLPVLLVFLTFVLMLRFFTEVPVRLSLICRRRRSRRSPKRRRAPWFSFVVFPVTLSLRLVSTSAMSREGFLTSSLFQFTVTLPVEHSSGCRRTCHAVDSVQTYQLSKELSYQPTSSLFPSPGKPVLDIPLWFAPFKSYDTRSTSFTRVNPSFIGSSSFFPPLKVKLLSPAWIFTSDCTAHLRRILSGVLSSGTEVQCRSRSGASLFTLTAWSELSTQFDWAWPIWAIKLNSPSLILPNLRVIEGMIRPLLVFDVWIILSDISGGFTRNSSCCVMPYLYCGMILLVGSPGHVSISPSFSSEKCPLPPSLLSMKGDVFLVSLPSISFSFFTSLLSCGAVCTGPEDAIEITHVFLVGESWLSTSLVTISQLSDFVVKTLLTQSSFVLISLSSSPEELSILTNFARDVYVFNLRGWLIPSVQCNRTS